MVRVLSNLLKKNKNKKKIQKKINFIGKKILNKTYKEINFILKK